MSKRDDALRAMALAGGMTPAISGTDVDHEAAQNMADWAEDRLNRPLEDNRRFDFVGVSMYALRSKSLIKCGRCSKPYPSEGKNDLTCFTCRNK